MGGGEATAERQGKGDGNGQPARGRLAVHANHLLGRGLRMCVSLGVVHVSWPTRSQAPLASRRDRCGG